MECRYCGKDWSENIISIHEDRCEQNPANMPDEPEIVENTEELIEDFYVGNGWYEIPGVDKKLHREEAIEALEEVDN